jgi:tetratricopeptide (TPR) repeat protein
MTKPKSRKRKKLTKLLFFIGIGLVVSIGVVFLTTYLTHTGLFSEQKNSLQEGAKQLTPEQVDKKIVDQQKDQLTKKIQSEPDASKKADQQTELATIYYNEKDYQKALVLAHEAEASHASASSAAVIAQNYVMLGNYRQAVKYYGLAMERSDRPASATERAPYNDYQNLKKEAEAKL